MNVMMERRRRPPFERMTMEKGRRKEATAKPRWEKRRS